MSDRPSELQEELESSTLGDSHANLESSSNSPAGALQPAEYDYYNPSPTDLTEPVRLSVHTVETAEGTRLQAAIDVINEGASSMSSVFTLCNSAIGAGVLSLPYAFQCAVVLSNLHLQHLVANFLCWGGAVGCLVLCIGIGACEAFTLYVLAKFAERYSAPSYGQLVRKALGRKTSAALSAILLVYLWGSCIAYLVIIGDTFSSLASAYSGVHTIWAQRRLILVAIGACVLLPLCLLRNLSELEWVSASAVCGFVYTAGAVLVRGVQAAKARPNPWEDVQLFGSDVQALYAVSIVVFGFNCHANVVTIFAELEHYPHRIFMRLPAHPSSYTELPALAPRPKTYKLIGMLGVIIAAMVIIMAGYMSVGIAGYLAFPLSVSSNVLNSFPQEDIAIQVARGVIGLVVASHFPLNHHPARAAWEDLADSFSPRGSSSPVTGRWISALLTLLFVGSAVATSLFVTDLGAVLHLIGGTAAAFMIFLLPGLLLMNAAIIKVSTSYSTLCQEDDGEEAPSELSVPLITKKAGIRESGLIYSPRKSWWAGLCLVMLAGLVMAVTLVTALIGSQ